MKDNTALVAILALFLLGLPTILAIESCTQSPAESCSDACKPQAMLSYSDSAGCACASEAK